MIQLGEDFPLCGEEGAVCHHVGGEVVLQVIAVQFQGQLRVSSSLLYLPVGIQRLTLGVNNVHFQFRPQGVGATTEARVCQQLL